MDNVLLGVIILVFVLCMIYIIIKHNKSIKQAKLNQLRDIKSHINNALSLYDCLYIHINMYKKGFAENKPLSSEGMIFLLGTISSKTVLFKDGTLEYIEGHYEVDTEPYKSALATYRSKLLSEVNLELNKYNY